MVTKINEGVLRNYDKIYCKNILYISMDREIVLCPDPSLSPGSSTADFTSFPCHCPVWELDQSSHYMPQSLQQNRNSSFLIECMQ